MVVPVFDFSVWDDTCRSLSPVEYRPAESSWWHAFVSAPSQEMPHKTLIPVVTCATYQGQLVPLIPGVTCVTYPRGNLCHVFEG
eukprot:3236587-Rhodomonas_salina.1